MAFDSQEIELIEEDAKGDQNDIVIMTFGEFRNLQIIILEHTLNEEKRR